jgi:hypothetical protein
MASRLECLRQCALMLALAPLFALPDSMALSAESKDQPSRENELSSYRKTAEDLYNATTSDAHTFERAIADPEVRKEVERVFKRKLSDEQLKGMALQAKAEADYWSRYLQGLERLGEAERRIPGQPPPPEAVEPIENPAAISPPQAVSPSVSVPIPDRWRILDALGRPESVFDPYNTNTLKADKPIFGEDWFFNFGAISDTLYEPSRVPTPVSAIAATRPGSNNTFGRYGQSFFSQQEIVTLSLIEGNTAFKPPDFELRLTPVINFNHTSVGELGVININPQAGTVRNQTFGSLQEGFVDYHLRNVSEYYDFDSLRVGIQPFNFDFRGFVFQDSQPGIRLFGDRDANRWQYNLAFFDLLFKDTNSGLNDLGEGLRKDYVFVANLYRQDFPAPGFTSQIVYALNVDNEANTIHYDKNGFLVIPAQIGDNRGYNYNVSYLGINGDGHLGRFNLTGSGYWATGHLSHNQFSPIPNNNGAHINAFFAAAEPSIDFDYVRVRLSGLFQSGDGNPQGGHATGFDSIFENPLFAGSDASYFIRQSLPYIGGGIVGLNQPNGVLADVRSSKLEGQSNFINSGLILAGIGTDTDILPELRMSTNVNYLRAAYTQPLEFLRHQAHISNNLGYDLSVAFTYRPLDTQNIIFRVSGAALIPANGLKAIYQTNPGLFSGPNFLYAAMINMILTY